MTKKEDMTRGVTSSDNDLSVRVYFIKVFSETKSETKDPLGSIHVTSDVGSTIYWVIEWTSECLSLPDSVVELE